MKYQPDERKIKGCYYIKKVYHDRRIKEHYNQIEHLKKKLSDIRSAINFIVRDSKEY